MIGGSRLERTLQPSLLLLVSVKLLISLEITLLIRVITGGTTCKYGIASFM